MQLKIISLNIWRYYGNWSARKKLIVEYLQREKPDIVCLQESYDDIRQNKAGEHQTLQLHALLKSEFPFFAHDVIDRRESERGVPLTVPVFEGLGVLSKYKIANSRAVQLPRNEGDKHTLGYQRVECTIAPKKKMLLYNVHFINSDEGAVKHLTLALEHAKAEPEKPLLIGDFNMRRIADLAVLTPAGYRHSFEVSRYLSLPGKRETLDYAAVPSGWVITFVECIDDGMSDHRPLVVVVEKK